MIQKQEMLLRRLSEGIFRARNLACFEAHLIMHVTFRGHSEESFGPHREQCVSCTNGCCRVHLSEIVFEPLGISKSP